MFEAFTWLLAVEALGLAALPLALWLLRALPDRGVAFAKPLGLLVVGYVIWLGSALGVLASTRPTALAVAVVFGAATWLTYGHRAAGWLKLYGRRFIWSEGLFLAGFMLAALLRAYNPEIAGTEKPMDFAFLNAAIRDTGVPPQDPWLAGYGISYYYFGYFLFGLVAKAAATPPGIAFNLALASLFGMVAAGAFSLVWNLVAGREQSNRDHGHTPVRYGLLGAAFVLLLANLEGALEVLFVNRLLPLDFWRWLGIKDLMNPARGTGVIPTDPPDTWWWWRASRVVGDFDPATGVTRDYTINEFPFFSFLLGDLHPHVMALPFVFLALALALALLRERAPLDRVWFGRNAARAGLVALAVGALGFLNSWDLPVALAVLVLAVTAQRGLMGEGPRPRLVRQAMILGVLALAAALVLFVPFYVGFRTQASGIGVVATRTKLQHLFVVWAPLLCAAGALPVYLAAARGFRPRVSQLLWWGALAGVVVFSLVAIDLLAASSTPGGSGGAGTAIAGALSSVVLGGLLAPAFVAYWRLLGKATDGRGWRAEDAFAVVLVGLALALLLVCEFVFVRDGFGNRMNTVFKLYYQAWALLAPAAAYALYFLGLRRREEGWKGRPLAAYQLWRWTAATLLALGFVYTVIAPLSKTNSFAGEPTLDGTAWLERVYPQEHEAIAWLAQQPGSPVLLEASGGEYSEFNRASAFTGLPSVLGWAGHEYQWRGMTPEPAQRKADIDAIYQTPDPAVAERLLRKYDVTFVYVGDQERQAYTKVPGGALDKFTRIGQVAFRNDRVTIYRVQ